MNVNLTPEQERIVNDELRAGHFRSVEELIGTALAALREKEGSSTSAEGNCQQAGAVQEMLSFVAENRTRLQDVPVKQLIHEGHRL
jgi:Arc/MetJ-type ribon-helix-helix transcriptional regulator